MPVFFLTLTTPLGLPQSTLPPPLAAEHAGFSGELAGSEAGRGEPTGGGEPTGLDALGELWSQPDADIRAILLGERGVRGEHTEGTLTDEP